VRKSRYSDEEIADTVRQAEAGESVIDIVRKLGISEATFQAWKKRIARLRTNDVPLLRDANAELISQVSDLLNDRQTCKACAPSASASLDKH
jgi:putative transposase